MRKLVGPFHQKVRPTPAFRIRRGPAYIRKYFFVTARITWWLLLVRRLSFSESIKTKRNRCPLVSFICAWCLFVSDVPDVMRAPAEITVNSSLCQKSVPVYFVLRATCNFTLWFGFVNMVAGLQFNESLSDLTIELIMDVTRVVKLPVTF